MIFNIINVNIYIFIYKITTLLLNFYTYGKYVPLVLKQFVDFENDFNSYIMWYHQQIV